MREQAALDGQNHYPNIPKPEYVINRLLEYRNSRTLSIIYLAKSQPQATRNTSNTSYIPFGCRVLNEVLVGLNPPGWARYINLYPTASPPFSCCLLPTLGYQKVGFSDGKWFLSGRVYRRSIGKTEQIERTTSSENISSYSFQSKYQNIQFFVVPLLDPR